MKSKQEAKVKEETRQYLDPGEDVVAAIVARPRGWTQAMAGSLVVLDLGGVEFIDSTALGTLLKAGDEVESAGKRMRVVCAEGPVRRLLEMTNLTNRFQLCPTRDVAFAPA